MYFACRFYLPEMVTIPAQTSDPFSETVIGMMKQIEDSIKDIPGRHENTAYRLLRIDCNKLSSNLVTMGFKSIHAMTEFIPKRGYVNDKMIDSFGAWEMTIMDPICFVR